MLVLDMTHLSQEELRERIAAYCADFGQANVLNVLPPETGEYGAAAVEMSDPEAADSLARRYSGSRCGCKVIIRLAQIGQNLPNGLKRHSSPFAPAVGAHYSSQQH